MMRRTSKAAILLAAAAAFVAGRAEAGLIPNLVTTQSDGTQFRWTYSVVVTTDVKVNTGDFFTIYDFGGLVPGSVVSPTDWVLSQSNVGPTPAGTNPADDPNVANLTFSYTGAESLVGQLGLGNYSAISQFGEATTSDFTSITHTADGRAEANITTTDVPVPQPVGPIEETPEPATLAMLGLGLPVVGLGRWLRRRSSK